MWLASRPVGLSAGLGDLGLQVVGQEEVKRAEFTTLTPKMRVADGIGRHCQLGIDQRVEPDRQGTVCLEDLGICLVASKACEKARDDQNMIFAPKFFALW